MHRFLTLFVFFSIIIAPLYSQDQSAELRKSVRHVKEIIESLEIYDQLDKKRLYGAISQKGAIEFKLQSSPIDKPTSAVIGVATDGTIQEMEIKVFTTNAMNEPLKQIRRDLVQNEKDWVFEIMDNSQNYLIDIRVIKSRRSVALVEVIHGFFYGNQSDPSFSSTDRKTNNPSSSAPKQDGDSLAPIDVYNRFEMFRKSLWD
ncbi:MAG: hypothetical protein JJT78_06610 [Leptospira sp.]|nr:hypothetical protein [Leptospira sp.]